MESDSALNRVSESVSDLQVFWRKPTADACTLQVIVQSMAEVLIVTRIADEAGVEFNRSCTLSYTSNVSDHLVRNAAPSQECFLDPTV
jgi:hypothetical protein